MDINKNQKARAWELENQKNGTVTGFISTYEGKDKDGERKWSSWYARFVGDAALDTDNLDTGDTIILKSAKIENTYDKKKKQSFIFLTIFDFEKFEPEEEDRKSKESRKSRK